MFLTLSIPQNSSASELRAASDREVEYIVLGSQGKYETEKEDVRIHVSLGLFKEEGPI